MSAKKDKLAQRKHPHTPETWHERLDKAVMEHFKAHDVFCTTSYDLLGTMSYVTYWRHKSGAKLPPALAKQVRAYVAGFMAAEEYYA